MRKEGRMDGRRKERKKERNKERKKKKKKKKKKRERDHHPICTSVPLYTPRPPYSTGLFKPRRPRSPRRLKIFFVGKPPSDSHSFTYLMRTTEVLL